MADDGEEEYGEPQQQQQQQQHAPVGEEDFPAPQPKSFSVFWFLFIVIALIVVVLLVVIFVMLKDPSFHVEQNWVQQTGSAHAKAIMEVYGEALKYTQDPKKAAAVTHAVDRFYPHHLRRPSSVISHQRHSSQHPDSQDLDVLEKSHYYPRSFHFQDVDQIGPYVRDIALEPPSSSSTTTSALIVDGIYFDEAPAVEFTANSFLLAPTATTTAITATTTAIQPPPPSHKLRVPMTLTKFLPLWSVVLPDEIIASLQLFQKQAQEAQQQKERFVAIDDLKQSSSLSPLSSSSSYIHEWNARFINKNSRSTFFASVLNFHTKDEVLKDAEEEEAEEKEVGYLTFGSIPTRVVLQAMKPEAMEVNYSSSSSSYSGPDLSSSSTTKQSIMTISFAIYKSGLPLIHLSELSRSNYPKHLEIWLEDNQTMIKRCKYVIDVNKTIYEVMFPVSSGHYRVHIQPCFQQQQEQQHQPPPPAPPFESRIYHAFQIESNVFSVFVK